MSQDFKQCPNGHYYQGDHCPYCKSSGNAAASGSMKTEVFGNQETVTHSATEVTPNFGGGGAKTMVIEGGPVGGGYAAPPQQSPSPAPMSGRTMFGDMDDIAVGGGRGGQQTLRESRKLVGWLVSYTLDPLGVDFKLYEGRNIIGRDMDCNITVNDNMVSSRHAVLLFRAGKYSITDSQSSHGTFVNDADIELEPCYLQDGDVIRMGQTVLKFRSAF